METPNPNEVLLSTRINVMGIGNLRFIRADLQHRCKMTESEAAHTIAEISDGKHYMSTEIVSGDLEVSKVSKLIAEGLQAGV